MRSSTPELRGDKRRGSRVPRTRVLRTERIAVKWRPVDVVVI
jgi:hypothetical protein